MKTKRRKEMAGEKVVRGREDEPTRFAAWQRAKRGSAAPVLEDDEEPGHEVNGERDSGLGVVGLRLSRRDRERFEREARAEGVSLSEYLRAVLHDLEEDPELEFKQFVRDLATAKKGLEAYIEENEGMKPSGFLEEKNTLEHAKEALEALSKFCERLTKKPGEKKAPDNNPKKVSW
jgi:predicted HicB family RNase H-like nuclease